MKPIIFKFLVDSAGDGSVLTTGREMKQLTCEKISHYVLGLRPSLEKESGNYYIHMIIADLYDLKDVFYIRASTSFNGSFF